MIHKKLGTQSVLSVDQHVKISNFHSFLSFCVDTIYQEKKVNDTVIHFLILCWFLFVGLINDATGSYNISFYLAGCLCFFSVITFATVLKLSKWCCKPESIEQTMEAIEVEMKEVHEKVTSV